MKKYTGNGLVMWTEQEIVQRESIANMLIADVKDILYKINPAIQTLRIETPSIMPQEWAKGHLPYYLIDKRYALRGESTKGTYFMMDQLQAKLPICIYQINKSFRDEKSNAIRISNYRLREFWQIEFQLFYSPDTKANYHQLIVEGLQKLEKWGIPINLPSNDLPPYSSKTTDFEINGVEVASLSTRTDYKIPVFEISFGLDRLVIVSNKE